MTPKRLKEIKARWKAATEGPWELDSVGIFQKRDTGQQKPVLCADEDGYMLYDEVDKVFLDNAITDLPDCTKEIERLQGILREVTTKHSLLKGLSEYGPCRCHADQSLCMKHAAADILKMIGEGLESNQGTKPIT